MFGCTRILLHADGRSRESGPLEVDLHNRWKSYVHNRLHWLFTPGQLPPRSPQVVEVTEKEGAYIIRRINRDRQDADEERFALGKFLKPALDLKVWGFAFIFL
jgi:hypothetical protein